MREHDGSDATAADVDSGLTEGRSRRAFLKIRGRRLDVLVSALRSLVRPTPAHGDPPHAHCAKVYVKVLYQKCVGTRMIAYHERRCSVCWYICSTFTDDNGPCPR